MTLKPPFKTSAFPNAVEKLRSRATWQISNAYTFGRKLYVVFEVMNVPSAALLLEVTLGEQPECESLMELTTITLNYLAQSPGRHWVIDLEGLVHARSGDAVRTMGPFTDPSTRELSGIADIDGESFALLGEGGGIFRVQGDTATELPTGTTERILEAHFVRPDLAWAVGEAGTFLKGGVQGFTAVNVPPDAFHGKPIVSVHARSDGGVMLGTGDGPAFLYENGALLELEGLTDELGSVTGVCVFQGVEYWGANGFGLLTRNGKTLAPKFETGGLSRVSATSELMTVIAGAYVYVFDGREWLELRFNAVVDQLLERVPLDLKFH